MGNHAFNVVVVLFWLATMSWLFVAKVLPPLRIGEPPNYASIFDETHDQPPVCWSIRLRDRTIGWAATKSIRRKDGITELYGRVYLGELPLADFVPGWLGTMLKPVLRNVGNVDFDKKSRMVLDPLGRPVDFESRVRVAELSDAMKIVGQVEGASVKITVQSGDLSYKMEPYLPPSASMTEELSPQARMPGLRVGQTWTVPMYSPLRPPNDPIEILQASVEREDRYTWEGEPVNARVIVYRADAGSPVAAGEARGRVWVRNDGLVLCQEVSILQSRVRFVRMGDAKAHDIWGALDNDWMGPLSPELAKRLLERLDTESR